MLRWKTKTKGLLIFRFHFKRMVEEHSIWDNDLRIEIKILVNFVLVSKLVFTMKKLMQFKKRHARLKKANMRFFVFLNARAKNMFLHARLGIGLCLHAVLTLRFEIFLIFYDFLQPKVLSCLTT